MDQTVRPPRPVRGFLPDDMDTKDETVDTTESSSITSKRDDQSPITDKNSTIVTRILGAYWHHKLWTIPATILVVVGIVLAAPTTRYPILALFMTRVYTVTVTDSATGTPVSGAKVLLDGTSKLTNSGGMVTLKVPVGSRGLEVTKTYYKTSQQTVLVDVMATHNLLSIRLVATGRQVPIKVTNKITGQPIPEAVLTFGSTNAKTDTNGQATVVLPTGSPTQATTITVDGYNEFVTKVQVTTAVVDANTFALVPMGHIYFLSNLSGKIDVVSTNLDGTERKTVLPGTGAEDANNTVLLAARDWRYLTLLSKRDGGQYPKLFLIDTTTNKTTTIDSNAANYTLVGWSNHYFLYQLGYDTVSSWQPSATILKSYDADGSKSIILAASNATGTSNADATYQTIWQAGLVSNNLIYAETWYRYPGYVGVSGQQNILVSIKPDGTGGKVLKTVDAGQYYVSSLKISNPNQMYFAVFDTNTSNPNYYRLDGNGNITQSNTITSGVVNQAYPTYLISPSGKFTFWSEARDGKNTLFTGDYTGGSGATIATLSDYASYGWYSDDYLLVQKSNSELYIMSVTGGTPLKVSDYFKPNVYLYGYGGGYGGL
jgi:hypothetical protein